MIWWVLAFLCVVYDQMAFAFFFLMIALTTGD